MLISKDMADIAMLVAEEYERRINNLRKLAAEREMIIKQSNNAAAATAAAPPPTTADVVNVSIMADGIKIRKFVEWVLEPKSQITLAAFDGFFSA